MKKPKLLVVSLLIIGTGVLAWFVYGHKQPNTPPAKIVQRVEQVVDEAKQRSFQGQDVLFDVPFSPQAPFAEWSDPRQEDGCEEAGVVMAMRWVNDKSLTRQEALDEILALSKYEEEHFGTYHDTSAQDTVKLMKEYYGYGRASVKRDIGIDDIKEQLAHGNLVLVPADGVKLRNPNFKQPGPPRHMLVIKGYDDSHKQFITNDPGTRKGQGYRYDYDVLLNAVLDYPTGHLVPVDKIHTVMIIIEK